MCLMGRETVQDGIYISPTAGKKVTLKDNMGGGWLKGAINRVPFCILGAVSSFPTSPDYQRVKLTGGRARGV